MGRKKNTLSANGKRIKKALLDKGISDKEFAELIGTSPVYLCKILYGKVSGETYFSRIAQALDIDIEKLERGAA